MLVGGLYGIEDARRTDSVAGRLQDYRFFLTSACFQNMGNRFEVIRARQ